MIDPVLDYATYLGAGGSEAAKAIAVDSAGCAYIAGSTDGDSLPVTAGAVQPARAALTDVFVAKLDATGGNLVYCTYLGGTQHESPGGIAVDAYGRASVAGYTASTDFPTTAGAFQVHQSGGDGSAFVIRLDATGTRFLYSTYLGGSGHDAASAIALDSLGCAFVTGHTLSADFPVTRRPAPRGRGYDVFLTRLNASGSAIAYSTCLGGSEAEFDSVIALGPGGSVFLAGSTESPDFPTTRGAFQPDTTPQAAPQLDGFLVRVNASGASLDYATRLGGTYNDQIAAVDVDAAGCAYVAGRTASLDFPTTPGALKQGPTEGEDAFVAKVSAGGTSLLYATCLGGANSDVGQGIAVDASGCASAVGTTSSPDFPTTPGSPQPGPASQDRNTSDFFVTRVNSGGTGLIYSTYVGGGNHEWGGAIALGNDGSAFVTGHSESLDFPTTTGAFQATWHGASDAVILRLNPAGTGLLYSTYLGGQGGEERGNGIAVDAAGSAYIVGSTESVQFPITGGCLQPERGASQDAFVSKLSPAGDRLVYSTYLGGSGLDSAAGVVVDSAGNACVGGTTRSPDFPITAGALQSSLGGTSDAFVSRLDASGSSLLSSTYLGGSGEDGGNSLAHDASGCLYLAGSTGSHDFPVTATAAQAQNRGPIYAPFDAFIAKLSPPASSLIYATYLGGSSNEGADGIAVDAAGCAYVTGGTWSLDFPVTPGAWYRERRAYTQQRAFVAKANAAGTQFLCATCLGASGWTVGTAIAVDSAGCAYMTGVTNSADFPTTPGAIEQSRTSAPQGADAFVTKLNSVGSSLVYSTYLGRRGFGSGSAIAVDALGCACLAGTAYQWYTQPCLAKLNSSGTALIQSVFLQGTGWPYGLALDREGRALLTGEATWDGFQCTSGVPQATYAGAGDVFVARLVLSVGVLHFSRQPADASAGTSLPPVQVSVTDASGRAPVVPVPVTLAIASGTGPSGAVLKGATVARSAGGAATFRSLYLSTMGEGYRLIATAPGCAPVTSAPFAVSAGAPYRLAFTVQPANAPANASIQPAVQVAVQDRYGNPCSGATAAVTLSLARSPAGSTLSGTVTCVPVLGLATFTDLQLDTRGVYVLKADCGALQMAQSKAFTVLMPSTVP